MSRGVCDFCGEAEPTWLHPSKCDQHIVMPNFHMQSTEGWAACEECSSLVGKKDVEGLVNRLSSREGWEENYPEGWAFARRQICLAYTHVIQCLSPRQPWYGPAKPVQVHRPEEN